MMICGDEGYVSVVAILQTCKCHIQIIITVLFTPTPASSNNDNGLFEL